jgi:hypothetical protein
MRGDHVNPAGPEMTEIELVELSRIRQRVEPDPKCKLGCMVFRQQQAYYGILVMNKLAFSSVDASNKQKYCRPPGQKPPQ